MRLFIATLALLAGSALAQAQTATAPSAGTAQKNMVVNPTQSECTKGWSTGMKWSKSQFDQYCATLRKSK